MDVEHSHLDRCRRSSPSTIAAACSKGFGRMPHQAFLDGVATMRSETEVNPEAAWVTISSHWSTRLSADLQLRTTDRNDELSKNRIRMVIPRS